MKKIIAAVLLLSSILCLFACGKEIKPQAVTDNTSGKCEQSAFMYGNSNIAIGADGYYILDGLGDYKYLTYISKSSAESTYLCSKPECRHVDESGLCSIETCNAYVGAALPQSVVYHNGYVYVLRYDEKTYDVTLVKISADGSVHEDIMVVGQSPDLASYYKYAFADDKTIFMVYNSPDSAGKKYTISLDRIDLNKKEKNSVYQYTDTGANINNIKGLNNNIFFIQFNKKDDQYNYTLMRYDIESEKVSTVLQDNVFSYTLTGNGELFYYVAANGMYCCDLQTMKSEKIRECDKESMYASLAYDGTYLYLDNMFNSFYYDKASSHKIFVCDTKGNTVSTIPTGVQPVAVSDPDYMFTQEISNGGIYWMYIKKEDVRNDAVWHRVK